MCKKWILVLKWKTSRCWCPYLKIYFTSNLFTKPPDVIAKSDIYTHSRIFSKKKKIKKNNYIHVKDRLNEIQTNVIWNSHFLINIFHSISFYLLADFCNSTYPWNNAPYSYQVTIPHHNIANDTNAISISWKPLKAKIELINHVKSHLREGTYLCKWERALSTSSALRGFALLSVMRKNPILAPRLWTTWNPRDSLSSGQSHFTSPLLRDLLGKI